MRCLGAVVALVLLAACGSASGSVPGSAAAPAPAPADAVQAVYFTLRDGVEAQAVVTAVMGTPRYIERMPSGGANPGEGNAPPPSNTWLLPVNAGHEAETLSRFKANVDVKTARLGRWPPIIPA